MNRYHFHPLDQRCCSQCRQVYQGIRENFHIKKHTSSGISWNVKCKVCFNEVNQQRITEYRKYPEKRIPSLLTRFSNRAREIGVPFDLDSKYLLSIWESQNGRCYYTGEEISFLNTTVNKNSPHPLVPSLDRVNPALGYTKGNVVWCAYVINRMKNEFDEELLYRVCERILAVRETRNV